MPPYMGRIQYVFKNFFSGVKAVDDSSVFILNHSISKNDFVGHCDLQAADFSMIDLSMKF